jgi:hypothetical protein
MSSGSNGSLRFSSERGERTHTEEKHSDEASVSNYRRDSNNGYRKGERVSEQNEKNEGYEGYEGYEGEGQ